MIPSIFLFFVPEVCLQEYRCLMSDYPDSHMHTHTVHGISFFFKYNIIFSKITFMKMTCLNYCRPTLKKKSTFNAKSVTLSYVSMFLTAICWCEDADINSHGNLSQPTHWHKCRHHIATNFYLVEYTKMYTFLDWLP